MTATDDYRYWRNKYDLLCEKNRTTVKFAIASCLITSLMGYEIGLNKGKRDISVNQVEYQQSNSDTTKLNLK